MIVFIERIDDMKDFVLKKCPECNKMVRVFKDSEKDHCVIQCCGQEMEPVKANSVDCAVEKHIPLYEKKGDKIVVMVPHVMEEDHFIEWVMLVSEQFEMMVSFQPGSEATAEFPYVEGATIYSYCNKHGLWKQEIR